MSLEEIPSYPDDLIDSIFDSELKKLCLKSILCHGILCCSVQERVMPDLMANFLLRNPLKEADLSFIAQNSNLTTLKFSNDSFKLPTEILRSFIASQLKSLFLMNCSLPSQFLDASDLACAQSESCQIDFLALENVYLSSSDKLLMNNLGKIMERVVNLKFGAVQANDSVLQSDEIFINFARHHLSKNKTLAFVDLRGSNIDIVAARSLRNMPINFAAEMRRWARRLKGLAFETDTNIIRVFRIINRQCPLLRAICLKNDYSKGSSVLEMFDNLRCLVDSASTSLDLNILEPMTKLRSLCLCGHFKVFDRHLILILTAAASELKYLNVSGCAVNFDRYWKHLPESLEELVLDEFSCRKVFISNHRNSIKLLLNSKCPNLKIYLNLPKFAAEEQECLRGLALLNGAQIALESSPHDGIFSTSEDYLVAFERRIVESGRQSNCINCFVF